SIIGMDPDVIWRASGTTSEINRQARTRPDAFTPCAEPPLDALRALTGESRIELPASLPPVAAGVFGYLGYDTVRLMEELPPAKENKIGLPDAIMMRPTIVIVFDAVKDVMTLVTPVWPDAQVSAQAAFARASERLSDVVHALDKPLEQQQAEAPGALEAAIHSNTTPDDYRAM